MSSYSVPSKGVIIQKLAGGYLAHTLLLAIIANQDYILLLHHHLSIPFPALFTAYCRKKDTIFPAHI